MMTDGIPLFIVPAGTYIDEREDGRLLFCEPGKQPYWITVDLSQSPPKVTKNSISISLDCKTELSVGLQSAKQEML